MPAGKTVKVGVSEGGKFIGCVIFGRGANRNLGVRFGLKQTEVCELVRVALRAHSAPVSRIVAIALKLLRRHSPGLRLVISYADPQQGHVGSIYQAGGWTYLGPSGDQFALMVNGREAHKRTISSRYGTSSPERLRAAGLQVEWGERRFKYTYAMPLDQAMRATLAPLSKPYPKKEVPHGRQRTEADADSASTDHRQPEQAPA